jgi:serine/threonine protein kinase
MEFVTGHTLSQIIASAPPDPTRGYRICRQIAAGLDAAHRQGVIHRDLKPSNIMVTPHEQVKVLDFGLAKVVRNPVGTSDSTLSRGTRSDQLLGTPGYMSPEQLLGRELDQRCDIWAFGCCLYECLTGRMAFAGETPADRIAASIERNPDWGALSELPEPIKDLLHKSLEKDPARRFDSLSSAIELIDRVCALR